MRTLHALRPLALAVSLASPALAQDGPPEFPPPDLSGLVHADERAYEGYTFIAPLTGHGLLLLDMRGEVAHRWDIGGVESVMLLDSGHLLTWGMTEESHAALFGKEEPKGRFQGPGVAGGLIQELDWEGNVLWRYELATDTELLHHDIALLPNGDVCFLAWEYKTREDALRAGRDPEQVDERGMWPDVVYQVRPTRPEGGEIVWEWHAWDHLVQDFDPEREHFGDVAASPGRIDVNFDHRGRPPLDEEEARELAAIEEQMAALGYGGGEEEVEEEDAVPRRSTAPDWMHTNAIDHLPEHDLLVLSSPEMNEVFVLDHSTSTEEARGSEGGRFGRGGDLLWRWGNPRNHGAGTDEDQLLSFQHDPTWLASETPGELRLLVFNNGRVRPGDDSYSSVDELVLPFDPEEGFRMVPGEPCAPEWPAWIHADPGVFYSPFISGAQRLANGNTLICSGVQGRVFEVTPDGEVVWDLRNPYAGEELPGIPTNALYRAVRVGKDHPGLAGRDL